MSDYVKATNFYAKDALLTGNPDKLIKGAEIDAEFNAISTAVATKANLNSPNFTGTPTVPTAPSVTNSTQAASTAYVTTALANAQANANITGGTIDDVDITGGTITGLDTDLAVADGGTGRSTLTAKNLLVGNGTDPINFISPGASGNLLISNGTDWTAGTLDFDKVFSNSGYQKLPSGLIIQWFRTSENSTQGSFTESYPIAFPNAFLAASCSTTNTTNNSNSDLYIQFVSSTTSAITLYRQAVNNFAPIGAMVIALGY